MFSAYSLVFVLFGSMWQRIAACEPFQVVVQFAEYLGAAGPRAIGVQGYDTCISRSNPINEASRVAGYAPPISVEKLSIFIGTLNALLGYPPEDRAFANPMPLTNNRRFAASGAPQLTSNAAHTGILRDCNLIAHPFPDKTSRSDA